MSKYLIWFTLLLCGQSFAQNINPEHKLLWEISGNGLKEKSYLFGTLHSNDRRIFNFSDSTYIALEHSKGIVLETDLFSLFPDWDTRLEEVQLLFDNSGKPYTGNDRPTKTIYGDENGMPQFMDAFFQEYCYNSGKTFYELEKTSDQINALNNWGQKEKESFRVDGGLSQEKLIEFYLKGDIATLDKLMRKNLSINPGMYEEIIIGRNQTMLHKIDSIIRVVPSFCAVGAGHLSGELGLINLLRLKGYRLRPVLATYVEQPVQSKANIRTSRRYTYFHEPSHLIAIFPGKPYQRVSPEGHVSLIFREFGQGNSYSIEILPNDPELTLTDQATIYIASPDATNMECYIQDDGTEICEGIGDTYPEGYHWIRLIQSDKHLIVMKAYGGNKFMNSNRPRSFFDKVGFE